jgi:4-hydroxybenzoate polyprenyltransferase
MEAAITLPVALARGRAACAALRPHQWPKNLLVLVPVATAQVWDRWPAVLLAAAAFCSASAATYLVNDLCDLAADRAHPHKCRRPLASGSLPVPAGIALAAALGALALAAGAAAGVLPWLLVYAGLTLAYSFGLKRVAWLDLGLLATFYILRLGAGAAALAVALSPWMAAFAAGAFLALGAAKRLGELAVRGGEGRRGWTPAHRRPLTVLALGAALLAAGVLAAYPASAVAQAIYQRPWWLTAAAAPFAWWLLDMVRLARAGRLHHDPVLHALRDPRAWAVLAALVAAWLAAGPRG